MTVFGVQCSTTTCPGGSLPAAAAEVGAGLVLCRTNVLTPFTQLRTGANFFVNQDQLAGDTQIYFTNNTGVLVGDKFSSPAWGDDIVVTAIGVGHSPPSKVTFDTPLNNYVQCPVPALAQIAACQTAGLRYLLAIYNLNGIKLTGSGPILTSAATWRNQVVLTLQAIAAMGQMPECLICENEEDGLDLVTDPGPPPVHNGDSSTVPQYLEKLAIVIDVGLQFGLPTTDSGTTIVGLQSAYWFYLFYTLGTVESRQQADIFVTTGFSKAPGQFNFAGNTPSSNNPLGAYGTAEFIATIDGTLMTVTKLISGSITTGPTETLFGPGVAPGTYDPPTVQYAIEQLNGFSGGRGQYRVAIPQNLGPTQIVVNAIRPTKQKRIQKVNQLLQAYAQIGTKYTNIHWYELIPQSMVGLLEWLYSIGLPQVIFGEVGTYSTSAVDVLAAMSGAIAFQAPYAVWWNEESVDNPPNAIALADRAGNVRNNGRAFASFNANQQPKMPGQPPLPAWSTLPA